MTTSDITTAIFDAIRETRGIDAADWSALADLREEEGGENTTGIRYAALFARCLAGECRLDHQVRSLLAWLSEAPLTRTLSVSALLGALGQNPALDCGSTWRAAYKAIPYTGHSRVSARQRKICNRWQKAIDAAGGESTDVTALANRLAVVCLATSEFLA